MNHGKEPTMTHPTVEEIFVSPVSGAAMQARQQVEAFAGQGLEGDRFRQIAGRSEGDGRQMTLVARESLEEIEAETGIVIPGGKSRRNIITAGVRLNDLVGHRFMLGTVVCEGVEVCQPCAKMGEVLNEDKAKVVKALVHRSGLRARIVSDGTIHAGDTIRVVPEPTA